MTVAAILSLAVGIGVNTAVFTLVNAFLLRSLPVPEPGALVMFRAIHGAQGRMSRRGEGPGFVDPGTGRNSGTAFSLLTYKRFRTADAGLSQLWAFSPFSQVHVLVDGVPEASVSAQFVSGTYYAGLGVAATVGRVIGESDDRPSAAAVAVISHRFWTRRFGGDMSALGKTVLVNRVPTTIIGITPPGFDGALQAGETADLSIPLTHFATYQPDRAERAGAALCAVGSGLSGLPRTLALTRGGHYGPLSGAGLHSRAARRGLRNARRRPGTRASARRPMLAVEPGGLVGVRRQSSRSLRIAAAGRRVAAGRPANVFDVSLADPATCVSVAGALLTVALLASAIPAYRASRVEPIRALGLR